MISGICSIILFATLLFLFILASVFTRRFQKGFLRLAWLFAVVTLVCGVLTAAKIRVVEQIEEGIVLAEIVDVRYSPMLTGAVAFRLHEGIKTQILRQDGNWVYIRLSRDKSGWVERATLEEI